MPIIKSAIKRVRQTEQRRKRLLPYRTRMKTVQRTIADLTKEGKKAEAEKFLAEAFKAVDMAAKKNIIHSRTADRKKSRMSKMVAACK